MGDAATLTRPVTFRSKVHNYRLVRVPARDGMPDPLTGERPSIPGLVYEFKDFKLTVDDELLERDRKYFQERAEAADREFDGDPGTLEWLRGEPGFGKKFIEIDPSEQAPPPDEALTRITQAVAKLDRPALEELLAEERQVFKRQVVIDQAETGLAAIAEMEQPPPPQE